MLKKLSFFLVTALLAACGGGGSSSGNANSEGTSQPSKETIAGYSGLTSIAAINQKNAHEIIHHSIITSDLVNVLMFGSEVAHFRFDSAKGIESTSQSNCEKGSYEVTQTSNEKATATYKNCVSGSYTLNGSGEMTELSFNEYDEVTKGKLSFDDLEIKIDASDKETKYALSGDINLQFNNSDKATFDVLIKEAGNSTSYWLDSFEIDYFTEKTSWGGRVKTTLNTAGRIYFSSFGYVDFTTVTPGLETFDSFNRPVIASYPEYQVKANNVLHLKLLESLDIGAAITESSEDTPRFYTCRARQLKWF